MTDIELMADGRIFVFGTSLEVLDVLNQLPTSTDIDLRSRLDQSPQGEVQSVDRQERGSAS